MGNAGCCCAGTKGGAFRVKPAEIPPLFFRWFFEDDEEFVFHTNFYEFTLTVFEVFSNIYKNALMILYIMFCCLNW